MEEKYWKQFMKTGRIVDYLYYLVYDDFDTGEEVEIEISKNTFMYFQGLWKNKEDITHSQNKNWHMCRSKWNSYPETALIFSKPTSYYNYMNNILPIYKLYDVDFSNFLSLSQLKDPDKISYMVSIFLIL